MGHYLRYTFDVKKTCVRADVCPGADITVFLSSVMVRHWYCFISQFSPGPVKPRTWPQLKGRWVGTATVSRPARSSHALPETWGMSAIDLKQKNPPKKKNPERTCYSYMSKLNLLNGRKAICRSSNLHCIFIYHSHYT